MAKEGIVGRSHRQGTKATHQKVVNLRFEKIAPIVESQNREDNKVKQLEVSRRCLQPCDFRRKDGNGVRCVETPPMDQLEVL